MRMLCGVEYREAFDMFDNDGDGTISRSELVDMMSSLGQTTTEEEITAIMSKADKDGKPTIITLE